MSKKKVCHGGGVSRTIPNDGTEVRGDSPTGKYKGTRGSGSILTPPIRSSVSPRRMGLGESLPEIVTNTPESEGFRVKG